MGSGLGNRVRDMFTKPIEHLVSLDRCHNFYRQLPENKDIRLFLGSILKALDVTVLTDEKAISAIPKTGPLVAVSNHPFGAIEGIIMAQKFLSVRPDIKLMANGVLNRIPQLRQLLIPVNAFQYGKSVHANIGSLRFASQWVKQGGALLIFPSGVVSHFQFPRFEISDPSWNPVVGQIVHKTQAPVLPVYFAGSNGNLFQLAGMVHPWLRTALLPREFLNKRGRQIEMKIGTLLPYTLLKKCDADHQLASYLRWRTYLLGHTAAGDSMSNPIKQSHQTAFRSPVAPPLDPAICKLEIEQLPANQQLVSNGANTAWIAQSEQIPRLLLEIARLRELSFRQAGEGTGQSMDLDPFDAHYHHLFIWNHETEEIIGAYRLGCTDTILEQHGPSGLYTSTLFRCDRAFYRNIGPAIELGRSFVRPEYQKAYAPLLLLWRGIGQYVAQHPKYRTLFGAVSISRDYKDFSRSIMASALLRHYPADGGAGKLQPKSPVALKPLRLKGCKTGWQTRFCRDIDEIDSAICDIESDHKGIPILLKQYLKLGGRLIAFNQDNKSNDTLDGLIVLDLLRTDRNILSR